MFTSYLEGQKNIMMQKIFWHILLLILVTGSLSSAVPGSKLSAGSLTLSEPDGTSSIILKDGFIRIDSVNLKIIPPSTGIQFFGDRILFLADSKIEEKMLKQHVSFGKIQAYSAFLADTALADLMMFSPGTDFTYPCEAITFTSDFTTMYFTKRASRNKPEKIWQAKYSAEKKNRGWIVSDNPLSFCNDDHIYTHPALSSDGNIMIFASDRPGTTGELDLFITMKDGETWSDPRNLGEEINSLSDELYPYLDAGNNLFFSSDTEGGSGGYDIYICRFDGSNWLKPVNLSPEINTANDDIAFTMGGAENNRAFYTVRSPSSNNEMQLFRIMPEPGNDAVAGLSLSATLTGMVLKDDLEREKTIAFTPVLPVVSPATEPLAVVSEVTPMEEIIKIEKEPEVKVEEQVILHVPAAEVRLPPDLVARPAEEKTKTLPQKKKEEPAAVPSTGRAPEKVANPVGNGSELQAIYLSSSSEVQEGVVYRVQFSASMTPKESIEVTIDGKLYSTWGYFYGGAYRTTVGEFRTLSEARKLQDVMRKLGYNQAFVVAFKNDERVVYNLSRDVF